jgi:formylglycine-generating enzyme required for sulfatase activity
MEFVFVPGGCFQMGQSSEEKQQLIAVAGQETYDKYYKDELPRHEVCVDGFWLGKYEVTNGQYRQYQSGHDSKDYKGKSLNGASQPVVEVSWEDAQGFARWLSEQSGKGVRLPTESEWEYAARGGTSSIRYWGDDGSHSQACGYANVHDQTSKRVNTDFTWDAHSCDDGHAVSSPVGSFRPNGYGLHDMLGNVWEWCSDWHGADYYSSSPRSNPHGPSSGSYRVFRGGDWNGSPRIMRAANRAWLDPSERSIRLGFRLLLPQGN